MVSLPLPLAPETPLTGLGGLTLQDFWQLPVAKKQFDFQPEYYFGQIVFHKMRVIGGGEILHSVEVIGVRWTGVDWDYCCELPKDHPQFKEQDCEDIWLEYWELEAM